MLPVQLNLSSSLNQKAPILRNPIFNQWINIKDDFKRHYNLKRGPGMAGMLKNLGMKLEGRHHSGIDDCVNIARIVKRMQGDGWEPI